MTFRDNGHVIVWRCTQRHPGAGRGPQNRMTPGFRPSPEGRWVPKPTVLTERVEFRAVMASPLCRDAVPEITRRDPPRRLSPQGKTRRHTRQPTVDKGCTTFLPGLTPPAFGAHGWWGVPAVRPGVRSRFHEETGAGTVMYQRSRLPGSGAFREGRRPAGGQSATFFETVFGIPTKGLQNWDCFPAPPVTNILTASGLAKRGINVSSVTGPKSLGGIHILSA